IFLLMPGHYKGRSKALSRSGVESPHEISPGGQPAPEVQPHGAGLPEGLALDQATIGRQDVYLPVAALSGVDGVAPCLTGVTPHLSRVDNDVVGGGIGIDAHSPRSSVEADLSYGRVRYGALVFYHQPIVKVPGRTVGKEVRPAIVRV